MVQSRSATIAVLMVATLFHTACGARRHIPIDTRTEIRQLERAIHAEVNQVRSGMGLSNVRYDRNLAQIAREHSKDMARKQYFDHVSPTGETFQDRYEAGRYRCSVPIDTQSYAMGAENLFMGHRSAAFIEHPNGRREEVQHLTVKEAAKQVVQGWMNSPGHRANLVRPIWLNEGIGCFSTPMENCMSHNFCCGQRTDYSRQRTSHSTVLLSSMHSWTRTESPVVIHNHP